MSAGTQYAANLESLQQQEQESLQDALQQYEAAAQAGIPGTATRVQQAQSALATLGTQQSAPATAAPGTLASGQSLLQQAQQTLNGAIQGVQSGAQSFSNVMQSAATAVGNAATSTLGTVAGKSIDVETSIVYRAVAVLAGLILIAGAVYGFGNLKDTATTVARNGAELGAA
jgi:hypothetical protein